MAYSLDVRAVSEHIDALPYDARVALAEAFTLLRVEPWATAPINRDNPSGEVRTTSFGDGRGLLTVLVLEQQQHVELLRIDWVDINTDR